MNLPTNTCYLACVYTYIWQNGEHGWVTGKNHTCWKFSFLLLARAMTQRLIHVDIKRAAIVTMSDSELTCTIN